MGVSSQFGEATGASRSRPLVLPRIRELLIVAGASGAGKSTFLKLLASGELQEEIKAVLPCRAETWVQISAKHFTGWLEGMKGCEEREAIPGLVLHYDLSRGFKRGGYTLDPVLRLIDFAESITIVNLRPEPKQLLRQLATHSAAKPRGFAAQFGRRLRNGARSLLFVVKRSLPSKVTGRLKGLPISVRRTLGHMSKQPKTNLKVTLYHQAGWLDGLFENWAAYVKAIEGARSVQQVDLEPDPNGQVGQGFRWQKCTPSSTRAAIRVG